MADSGYEADGNWPSSVLGLYKSIPVPVDGAKISISNYRNAKHPPETGGTQDAEKVKDALLGCAPQAILARLGGPWPFVEVFTGKGSPANIAKVMVCFRDYADKYIAMNKAAKGPRKVVSDLLADENLSWQDTFQAICDLYLGLDCNGFVGNWVKICDHSLKLGPQQSPREHYNARRQTRTSVDQIEYWDVVVYADFSHIAVIEDWTDSTRTKIQMCQSAGGGPRMNEYQVIPTSPGKFVLRGGWPEKDVVGEVYIISPWRAA